MYDIYMLKLNIIIIVILVGLIGIFFYFKNKNNIIGNLKEDGYVLHRQFLDSNYCDRIMMTVNTEMFNKSKEEHFTEGKNRKNIALPLDENIKPIISIICKKSNILSEYKKPIMVDCGILLSYPKAEKTKWSEKSKIKNKKTVMIHLDNNDGKDNITQIYAGSHKNKGSKKLVNIKCNRGDMYTLDDRIIRRETDNNGENIKPLFYFSIKDDDNNIEENNVLKSEYRGKVYLS